MNRLKYSFQSVSLICDKGNEVKFGLDGCIVSNLKSREVILTAKRWKNIYVADLDSVPSD